MVLMKGDVVAEKILLNVKKTIEEKNLSLKLTAILVGNDEASKIYVSSKKKDCEKCGISSDVIHLPENTTEKELINTIERLNEDKSVTGILCQLPLPSHIDEDKVINAISYKKDADCFHPYNVGRLFIGNPVVEPCTPKGVIKMLEYSPLQAYSPYIKACGWIPCIKGLKSVRH